MAISPNALQEKIINESKQIEILIDNILRQKTISSGGTIHFTKPDKMEYSHFEVLKPKYIAVGWKDVTWNSHYDQRDGEYTYLEFQS